MSPADGEPRLSTNRLDMPSGAEISMNSVSQAMLAHASTIPQAGQSAALGSADGPVSETDDLRRPSQMHTLHQA